MTPARAIARTCLPAVRTNIGGLARLLGLPGIWFGHLVRPPVHGGLREDFSGMLVAGIPWFMRIAEAIIDAVAIGGANGSERKDEEEDHQNDGHDHRNTSRTLGAAG